MSSSRIEPPVCAADAITRDPAALRSERAWYAAQVRHHLAEAAKAGTAFADHLRQAHDAAREHRACTKALLALDARGEV